MKKRVVCVLLVFALLLNILPVTALAGVQDWTGNTEAENGDVLSQLSDLTGGQVEEARALLESLGLLDGQGNLNVNKSVLLDGAEMTLDEVMELLDDPETDLSRIAEVDGVPVALGDLRTMILIEKELARIQGTYFSGQAFTPEQMVMLEGLLGQIENEGISVHPMGLEGTGLVLTITPSPNNPTEINYELYNEVNAVLEYDLSLSGELPREGVTFHWKRVLGLFDSGYVKVNCEVQSASSGNFDPWEGEVTTLAPHGASGLGPGLRLNNASEFSGKLTVTLGSRWGNGFTTYVDGIVPFFIEFYASEGLTIAYGEDRGEVCAVPITVKNRREWQLSVDGGGSTCRFDNDGDTPGWNILNNDQAHDLWLTCRRMYENEGPFTYQVETTLGAMVTHTSMTGIIGYIKNALPMPVGYLGDYSLLGYYWNDQEVNLNANPARLTNGNTPYLTIDANEAVNKHKISFICSTMDYPPARLEANWPAQAALCKSIDGTVTDLHHIGGYLWFQTVSSRVTIYDKTPPGVQSIEIPAGTYTSGQLVPITITFSEPVRSENLSFLLNGERFGAGDLLINSTGNKAVGFYRVKDIDATTILVSSVSGLRDLFGNTTSLENNGYKGWSFEDEVILRSTLMKRAVESIELSRETVPPDDAQSGVTVTLRLNQHEAFRNKYANYNLKMGKAPFALKVTSPAAALPHIIETELCEEGNTVCARAVVGDLVPAGSGMTYTLDVIAYEEGDEKGTIVGGKSASFWLSGAEFVDGLEIIYPEGDRPQLSLCETYRPRFGLSFRGNPTYKTGTWSSSNPEIATIDEDGQVGLTGTSVGRVYFTFTADDGGLEDKNPFHVKKAVSREYTIIIGDGIVLLIPGEAGKIISRKGQDATVRWSGNVGMKSPEGAQYTIELFRGGRPGPNDVPLFTAKEGKDANSTVIPGGYLTELGTPAYTIRVSMPHPEIPSEVLTAFSSIDIHPKPAGVELTRPDSINVPDSQPVTIPWAILNYEAGHTTGELLVERVSTVNGKDVKEEVLKVILDEESGSCTLTPRAVNGLRETYMILLKAKNPADPVYSSDSFPLYVYNEGALELEVRGQKVTEITMSNESRVSGSLPTRTRDVMELREELGLIEYIGINYGDYSWSQLMDGIKWATSDRDKVSVNYRQGGLYEDISRFSMSTYLPETKMALSSVVDGTATITATHANTGMEARVTVDVKTLRNKFFIFQFTPMCMTEVSYKDKKGASKALFSNDEGVLALYEPEGIASDILVRSTDGEGNVWLGTIQEGTLLSGERDATRLQLYPLNNLKLRRAARAEIFLKKPDGSPYTGILTLRGGVYKNGGYCQNAGILGNDNQGTVRDGCQDQIVHIGPDGKLTIYMDVTQFWSAENGETYFPYRGLSPAEDIQYIFEIRDLDGFYPLLIYSNGNLGPDEVVRSAESIVTLDPYSGAPRPFIAHLAVDYGLPGGRLIDLKSSKGRVGPNDTYPEVNLLTTVLLWGQERDGNYDLKLCDEYGFVPGAQAGRVATYPFSSIPVVRNTILLSNASITKSGWVAPKKDMGLRLRLLREGVMLSELPAGPRLCDLTLVPTKLKDTPEIAGLVLELKGRSGVGENADMGSNNKILDGMMQVLNRLGGPADGSLFKMIITPSADNSVFNAFVWAGYNSLDLDDVDYDENGLAFDYKLAEGSLNVTPNLNDLTDMAKGSYDPKKTFKEAKKNQGDGEGTSSVDFGGQLEGYYEALIKYNFEEEKWEIYVLGGGFTAGFGITYTYTVNAEVGPVPITGTFALNGALQLDFKSAIRYSEQNGLPWADTVTAEAVNDYLTTLRINAYVEAFGGLGFDYSVVALKIGLFGKVNLDNQNKFLSRPYLADEEQRQLKGQGLQLSGEVGIKFVAQFLLISYELILASGGAGATWTFNDWDAIDEYWKGAGSGLGLKSAAGGFRPVSSTATLESRDYLETFARSWGARKQGISLFALDDDNGLEQLQSNAYPNSLPLVTADGLRLLYVCDHNSTRVEETRIYATERNSLNEQFPEGQEIASPPNFEGFGDSSLSLAGRKSFAVAAWVRQSASLSKGAGEPVNAEEQALLMNGTEIVASVFRGEGGWKSTRLTTDSTPDLAPVVAVSASKDQAIAVWRSVYAANTEDLLNFTERDRILYSHVWNLNDEWFPTPRVLYDGTSGAVKGITAAMLGDGEILVAYTLDTGGEGQLCRL